MQAFLNRLRTQSQSRSIASGSSSSSSNAPITPSTLNTNLDPAPPSSPTSQSQSQQPPFTGLRKIHPNQDALLSSSPPPTPSGPPTSFQSPLSHQQQQQQPIDRPLSPPTGPRRGSSENRKNNNKTVEVIRESNESDRPSLPSSIAGQFPEAVHNTSPDEEGRIRASGEEQVTLLNEGNLSRSSSRKTTGLFGAVPFSGATGTGTGWSTFGRSQRRRQSTDDSVPLPVKGTSADSAKISGDGVSRTSSQSKTTTPKTKSTNLSRSGSTKNPTQGGEYIYQPDVEQIEHYTRIPISSNPLTNTTLNNTTRIQSQAHDNNNNDSSLSRSDSLSIRSPQPDSAPSTSSPHRTVFIDNNNSADLNQKRQSRIAMEGTFPPRTTVVKPASEEGSGSPASLPFTFGRQSPTRPMAGELFDEFGSRPASQEQGEESKPFPLVGTPTTEFPPSPITPTGSHTEHEKRPHLVSDSSQPAPSLISDTNSDTRHLGEASSSVATLNTTGWSFGGALRGMPSFGSTGDELSHPRIVSEPSNEGLSSQIREDGRRRRSSARRHSSGKLLPGKKSLGDLGVIAAGIEPVVVMSAEVPNNSNSHAFPSQERISPEEEPIASTSRGHRRPTDDTTAVEPSTSTGQPLHIQPPEVSITGPTPRPSPARPHSDNRITSVVSTASTSTASPSTPTTSRLTELFRRAPEGYAHPSGVGIAGVGEPHSRRQSLKVMGKRKAGDSDSDAEGIVVFDERSNRPRTGSNAPSSYMRKRMKLSDASEKDAQPVRSAALVPTPSRSSKPSAAASVHSTASRPKSLDSTRPRSIASNRPLSSLSRPKRPQSPGAMSNISIPISAIVSPRAPSVRHSIASTSRVPGGERMRYQDPLKNRVQRRKRTDVWADSWSFERGMVIQAYLFLVGFAFPLAWWIGVVLPVTSRDKGKGKDVEAGREGKHPVPTVGVVDRSNSGLWTDVTPYDEEQKRLWRGRCLTAGVIGTVFWAIVIACAVVFSRR